MKSFKIETQAVLKEPFDIGETKCNVTEIPPALCPIKVTEFGSPPNAAI